MTKTNSGQRSERILEITGRGIGAASEMISTVGQRRGYTVGAVGPGSFRLERSSRPVWATGLAIVTMPLLGLGLVFLRIRTRESAVVTVFEDRTGVKARVVGVVDVEVLEQLTSAQQPVQRIGVPTATSATESVPVDPDTPRGSRQGLLGVAGGQQQVGPSGISEMPGSVNASAAVIPPRSAPSSPPQIASTEIEPPEPVDAADVDLGRTVARAGRSVSPVPTPVPTLLFPDGSERLVSGPIVIGRQPSPTTGDSVVAISDPSLSKSHVRIEPADGRLLVTDLQSTNGSSIRSSRGVQQCVPGTPQPIGVNEVLIAGEVEITVGANL